MELGRIRRAGHVARLGGMKTWITGFWWGNQKTRDHLESLGFEGRIILKLIFQTWDVRI